MPPLDFLQYFHWHYATDYDKRLIEEEHKNGVPNRTPFLPTLLFCIKD
jgi:hypothetical protein